MRPDIIREPRAMADACESARRSGRRVGFVPTMGGLHDGHLALVDRAASAAGFVAVSIFVNPTQFGPKEDFVAYPRDLDADAEKLATRKIDAIFAPSAAAMYPGGFDAVVSVGGLTAPLCGEHRPGHFDGVTTVVTKLFNIVGPCVAVFGRKDYQQLKVIEKLTRDLNLPVSILPSPTVREADGLAMSSRNAYLDETARARALSLSRGLKRARSLFSGGERRAGRLREATASAMTEACDSVDYIEVAHPESLVSYAFEEAVGDRALVAVAARIGKTRLIDNTVLGEEDIL